jgi:hypothetical protein
MDVEVPAKLTVRRAPICGILSVTAPLASFLVFLVADKTFQFLCPGDRGWLDGFAFVMLPTIGCFFGGLILAGSAALRDERYSGLWWIGLLLNSTPFIYGIAASAG